MPILILMLSTCSIQPVDSGTGNSDGDDPVPYVAPVVVTQSVPVSGGTVTDPNGCTLTFPSGALSSSTQISVRTFNTMTVFATEKAGLTGPVCGMELGPDGTTFTNPVDVTMTLPYALKPGSYCLCYWDATASKWILQAPATLSTDGKKLTTKLYHFSTAGIFDMPYDALGGLPDYEDDVTADWTIDEIIADWLADEADVIGGDQYYNGCCYQRCGYSAVVSYTYDGTSGSKTVSSGDTGKEVTCVMSYSYGGTRLQYSIDMTVYLDCEEPDDTFNASSDSGTLDPGESTVVTAQWLLDGIPIPNKEIQFLLAGSGSLSANSALTDAEGEARVTYTAGSEEGLVGVTARPAGCSCEMTSRVPREDVVTINVAKQKPELDFELSARTLKHFDPLEVTVTLTRGGSPLPGVDLEVGFVESSGMYVSTYPDDTYLTTDSLGEVHLKTYTYGAEGTLQVTATGLWYDTSATSNPLYKIPEVKSDPVNVTAVYEQWSAHVDVAGSDTSLFYDTATYSSSADFTFVRSSASPYYRNNLGAVTTTGVSVTGQTTTTTSGTATVTTVYTVASATGGTAAISSFGWYAGDLFSIDAATGAVSFLDGDMTGCRLTVTPYLFEVYMNVVETTSGSSIVRSGSVSDSECNLYLYTTSDATVFPMKEGTYSGTWSSAKNKQDWTIKLTKTGSRSLSPDSGP